MTGFRRSGKWWHALILLLVGAAIAYPSLNQAGCCAWAATVLTRPSTSLAPSLLFGVAAVISGILDLFVSELKAAIAAFGLTKH
jgi:hypothetical protein